MHRNVLSVSAVVCTLLGCSETTTIELQDSENRRFTLSCKDSSCRLTSAPEAHPSPPQPGGAAASFVVHRASRLYGICETWVHGDAPPPIVPLECRPLVCQRDEQCPPVIGLKKGSCANGLCIEPTGDVTAQDAVMLCLAGTGVPSGSSQQIERFAMGQNCGSPCIVPTVCRQP